MTYWIRWQSADGEKGERTGPYSTRREADAALRSQLRADAAAMEYGTGSAGVCTPDGELWRDDLDIFLGRYMIESDR